VLDSCMLTDGLTGTAAATTTAGLDAVLLEVGEVGMAGTRVQVHCAATVVLGPLILIADHDSNWSAQCNAELCARLDLDAILLIARGCQGALAGTAAGHLGLDIVLGELHTGRAAVDDTADRAAVRFAIAGGDQTGWNMFGVEGQLTW